MAGLYDTALADIKKRSETRRSRRNESLASLLSFLGTDNNGVGFENPGAPANSAATIKTSQGPIEAVKDEHGHVHLTRTPTGWSSTNAPGTALTTVNLQGKKVTVYKGAARAFEQLGKELERRGYRINSVGGYNYRNMTGGNKLSMHAYGRAVDINPARNPYGKSLVTDMPRDISAAAKRLGLVWGGDWRRVKDAMHFEYYGR